MIEASSLMIGVDSGPLHAAGATTTPTIGVWTQHQPVHFFDLAENVTHLVPGDHEKTAAGKPALDYFYKNYRHHIYKQLYVELPALTQSLLTGDNFEQLANKRFLCQLTSKGFNERYYDAKYALARLLRPTSILEFGVRTGYSAFAFLSACPQARYVGIDNNSDTHGGFSGAIQHAKSLLEGFNVMILEQSSGDYVRTRFANESHATANDSEQPSESTAEFDLVHVDGDHSFQGCFDDLLAAVRFHPRAILVDDYFGIPEVHAACDRFIAERSREFVQLTLNDTHNGATLFVPLGGVACVSMALRL